MVFVEIPERRLMERRHEDDEVASGERDEGWSNEKGFVLASSTCMKHCGEVFSMMLCIICGALCSMKRSKR